MLGAPAGLAAEDRGTVTCQIKENGKAASGTVVVLSGSDEVARGACGKALAVAAGSYTAMLNLDGALDGPQQRQPVTVSAGKSVALAADFATGILEVKILRQGRSAAGMAVIRKDGKQIGTLGSGVAAHISAGSYEVVARYRSDEKRFEKVVVDAGGRVVLDASFE